MDLLKAFQYSNNIYIASVCVAAIATFFIGHLGSRVAAEKDAELQKFRGESEAAIAGAKAESARAHSKSLEASQMVAEANARAEQARASAAEAISGQKRIELETERARSRQKELEAQVASANLEQEALKRRNLELQEVVEKERIARLRLEEKISPRSISTEQRNKLLGWLSPLKGLRISVHSIMETEPERFALQIVSVLQEAGLVVSFVKEVSLGRLPAGISLRFGPTSKETAGILAIILADAGLVQLPIPSLELPAGDGDTPTLIIGAKP